MSEKKGQERIERGRQSKGEGYWRMKRKEEEEKKGTVEWEDRNRRRGAGGGGIARRANTTPGESSGMQPA